MLNEKQKPLMKISFYCLLCVLFCTACDLLPFGGDEQAEFTSVPPTITSTEILPTTQIVFSTSTPEITITEDFSAEKSPTLRPSWTPFPTKTLRPTWTSSPTLTSTATKEVGWIVRDDFSKADDSWYVSSGSNWELGYQNGGYFLSVLEENVEITSSKSWLKVDDTRVIADVYREWGKGYWGISCRENTSESYYTIFITNEGEYGYGETRNGRVSLFILGESPDILTTKFEVNRIMAECRGNALTLVVNDVFMFKKEVSGIGSGWVGMMAGTMKGQPELTVIFDYIEIWGPVDETGE